MKLIVAIIQPDRLDYIASALRRADIPGLTVTQARGFGDENLANDWNMVGDLTQKLKVEIVIADNILEETLAVIQATIRSSSASDHGFIYVSDVLKTIHISPNEIISNEDINK